jgi:hypothetical protein
VIYACHRQFPSKAPTHHTAMLLHRRRDPRGRFIKGHSGNPVGRPRAIEKRLPRAQAPGVVHRRALRACAAIAAGETLALSGQSIARSATTARSSVSARKPPPNCRRSPTRIACGGSTKLLPPPIRKSAPGRRRRLPAACCGSSSATAATAGSTRPTSRFSPPRSRPAQPHSPPPPRTRRSAI